MPPAMQSILSNSRIVPCGPFPHRLVQPSRLYTQTEYKYAFLYSFFLLFVLVFFYGINVDCFSFEPFIYEIPREMSSVDKILKSLGAGDTPSIFLLFLLFSYFSYFIVFLFVIWVWPAIAIQDIVKVLHDINLELRGNSLNPFEIVSVCKMLTHIHHY